MAAKSRGNSRTSPPGLGLRLALIVACLLGLVAGEGLPQKASGQIPAVRQGVWTKRFEGLPDPRSYVGMAEDPARGNIVLFGGVKGATATTGGAAPAIIFGDTWVWDGHVWIPRIVLGGPGPTADPSMAWDGQSVVLFGGFRNALGGSFEDLGDTWIWDGAAWSRPASTLCETGPDGTPCHPEPRSGGLMVYDGAKHRTVLFGSRGLPGLTDTWTWEGTKWTKFIAGVGPMGPHPVGWGQSMVYDGKSQRVILFDVERNNQPNGQTAFRTWALEGQEWKKICDSDEGCVTPPFEINQIGPSTYDARIGKVLSFTGFQAPPFGTGTGTWTWDGLQNKWEQAEPPALSPKPPLGRNGHGFVYDSARGNTVLFGGAANDLTGGSTVFSDTWVYSAVTPDLSSTTLDSSRNPSDTGQEVTYTAKVAQVAGAGIPGGQVAFKDGPQPIGGCDQRPLDSAGKATCSVTYNDPGKHIITAAYGGQGTFSPSVSLPLEQVVQAPPPPPAGTPQLISIDPNSGPTAGGQKTLIHGSVLTDTDKVNFGPNVITLHPCTGVGTGASPCFTANAAGDQITAYTPAAKAGAVLVSVEVPGKGASSTVPYTYEDEPVGVGPNGPKDPKADEFKPSKGLDAQSRSATAPSGSTNPPNPPNADISQATAQQASQAQAQQAQAQSQSQAQSQVQMQAGHQVQAQAHLQAGLAMQRQYERQLEVEHHSGARGSAGSFLASSKVDVHRQPPAWSLAFTLVMGAALFFPAGGRNNSRVTASAPTLAPAPIHPQVCKSANSCRRRAHAVSNRRRRRS